MSKYCSWSFGSVKVHDVGMGTPVFKLSVAEERFQNKEPIDNVVPGQKDGILVRSLMPFLRYMQVCGLFFFDDSDVTRAEHGSGKWNMGSATALA